MKRIVVLLAGLAIALVGGATASAYPPSEAVLVPSTTTLSPGEAFDLTLQGCTPGETVAFSVEGSSASATCDDDMAATGTLTAPSTPGTYTVLGEGQTSGVTATSEITVVGDDEEAPAPDDEGAPGAGDGGAGAAGLPATGSSSTPVLQMAGISLLAGLGLIAVAFRRRHAAPTG